MKNRGNLMDEQFTPNTEDALDGWAFIEIFGHTQVAGRVSTKKLGVAVMIQIDVPKGDLEFSHSVLYGPASIFSMTPTTEEWCRKYAAMQQAYKHNILPYVPEQTKALPEGTNETDDEESELGF